MLSIDEISQQSDGFMKPPYQRRKDRQKQRRILQGKGNGSKFGVKGAPEPNRHLFIYRVDPSTSTDELKNMLINEHKVTLRDLECVSHTEAMYKSFKLTIPKSEFEGLFNEEIWPTGIQVRPYRMSRFNNPI